METAEASRLTPDLLAEFEANAKRSLETRMRYAFLHTYKPVLDDARYRSFDTMADYRRWCNENLPWRGSLLWETMGTVSIPLYLQCFPQRRRYPRSSDCFVDSSNALTPVTALENISLPALKGGVMAVVRVLNRPANLR